MYHVKLVAEIKQTPEEEEEVVPHVVQLISPPFLGRTVLTAGPAKFGLDLTKREHGVSFSAGGTLSRALEAAVTRSTSRTTAEGQHLESLPLHGVWGDRECPAAPGANRPGAAGGLHVRRQGSPAAGSRCSRSHLYR